MYSKELLDHFEHPRGVGEISDADVRVEAENPACGDVMVLTLKVAEGRIVEARFRTRGCVASIACGSFLTEWLHGRTLAEARAMQRQQIVEGVGGLANESMHASHLVADALRAALAKVK